MIAGICFIGLVLSVHGAQQGSCPPLLPLNICDLRCQGHQTCLAPQLCCPTSCGGAICVDPVTQRRFINIVKPGLCPSPPGGVWVCSHTCTSDSDCPRKLKCCPNRCGALVCTKAGSPSTTAPPVDIDNQPVETNNNQPAETNNEPPVNTEPLNYNENNYNNGNNGNNLVNNKPVNFYNRIYEGNPIYPVDMRNQPSARNLSEGIVYPEPRRHEEGDFESVTISTQPEYNPSYSTVSKNADVVTPINNNLINTINVVSDLEVSYNDTVVNNEER